MSGPLAGRVAHGLPVAFGVVTAGALVAVAVAPARLGLAGLPGLAQIVALRGLVGALLAATGLALVLLAVLLPRARRRPSTPPLRRHAIGMVAAVAVVLLLGAGAEGAALAVRGTDGITGEEPAPSARQGDVVVLVQNTKATLDADQLATEIVARGAEVVVLPETTTTTAERTAALVRLRSGRDLDVLAHRGGSSDISSTALLVDTTLGTVALTETLPGIQGSFVAAGPQGGVEITAVHTTSPSSPYLDGWRTSTAAAVATCGTSSIVAGDFNATLDHPMLRDLGRCIDAAAATRTAGVATWPIALPRALGAPIDHVLVDPSVWHVVRTAVLEPPSGTDHRGFEAVLRRVGS